MRLGAQKISPLECALHVKEICVACKILSKTASASSNGSPSEIPIRNERFSQLYAILDHLTSSLDGQNAKVKEVDEMCAAVDEGRSNDRRDRQRNNKNSCNLCTSLSAETK